jgi:hypothetical protein
MLLLHSQKSPDSLLQAIGWPNLIVRRPKDQVTDPHARVLKAQPLLCLLLELGEHTHTTSA